MIRGYIPGFPRPKNETRYGDAQVLTDGKYTLVIDGMIGTGANKLIKWLKDNGKKNVWLLVTHWHDDHFWGTEKILGDSYFSVKQLICPNPKWLEVGLGGYWEKDVKECIADGNRIIALAKKKGVKINHPVSGSKYKLGSIVFKCYKKQPKTVEKDDDHAWSFVNRGSIGCFFPELGYWTSGDGSGEEDQKARIQQLGLTGKVKFFKIDHHGNYCSESNAKFFKRQGADYCWYNDLEPDGVGTCEFTAYGARRCKQAGIHVFESVGDINFIAKSGKVVIYKDFKSYTYSCSYKGKSTLKGPNTKTAREVIAGKFGNSNDRITRLIDAGFYPIAMQNLVEKLLKEDK